MAENTRMRCYSNRNMSKSSSFDVVNALFAQNIGHRKQAKTRRKINIQELPPPDSNVQLSHNSLEIEINNTFDKLKEGSVYKPVTIKNNGVNNFSTESDSSKSRSKLPQVSFSHVINSPVIKRRRKRLKSSVKIKELISEVKKQKQEDTLDKPVLSSLEMEKATCSAKHNNTDEIFSLSNGTVNSKLLEVKTMDTSYEPFFSNTFRERVLEVPKICSTPNITISTPRIPLKQLAIVSDISPIPSKKTDKIISCDVLRASYEEINNWDIKFPMESTPLSKKCSTPKSKLLRRSNRVISGKVFVNEKENWFKTDPKLQMKPYVKLHNCLKISHLRNGLMRKSTKNEQSITRNIQRSSNSKQGNKNSTENFTGFTDTDFQYSAERFYAVNKSVTTETSIKLDSMWQPRVMITHLSDKVIQSYQFKKQTRSFPSLRNVSDNIDHKINKVPIVWLTRLNSTHLNALKKKLEENCCISDRSILQKDVSTEPVYNIFKENSKFLNHSVASESSRDIINEYLKRSKIFDKSRYVAKILYIQLKHKN